MKSVVIVALAVALAACAGSSQGVRLTGTDGPEAWSWSEYAGRRADDLERLLGSKADFGELGKVSAVLLDASYLAALRAERPDAATVDAQENKTREVDEFSRYIKDGKLSFRITLDLDDLPAVAGEENPWEEVQRWRFVLDGVPGRPGLKPETAAVRESALGSRAAEEPGEGATVIGGRIVMDAIFRVGIDKLDSGAALELAIQPPEGVDATGATATLRWRITPEGG